MPNLQDYAFCVIILVFLICHLCYSISAGLKTISREDAHLLYLRYLRVFLYMFNDLLSTPPPNLCDSGLGVSLSCTCVAFSLLLNETEFFQKCSFQNGG
jgi:hypothetical protein